MKDNSQPEFIKLNMLKRKNKQGIVLNRIWLILGPTQCTILDG